MITTLRATNYNKCLMGQKRSEMMDHLVVGLPVARHEYHEKHNRICRYLHWHRCWEFGAKGVNKQWYDHTPDPVTIVDSIQYFTTTKLCMVIKNKIRKWCKLIGTSPARKTYFEVAREKIEAQCPGNRIWQVKTETISFLLGAFRLYKILWNHRVHEILDI